MIKPARSEQHHYIRSGGFIVNSVEILDAIFVFLFPIDSYLPAAISAISST